MSQHTIKRFDEELDKLKELVLTMGGLVERAIGNSVQSLLEQDEALAKSTIAQDDEINDLEIQCDEMIRDILVRRQPAASDLRFILGTIKVVTDLERMGDLAAGISKAMLNAQSNPPKNFSNLDIMGEKVQKQVKRTLNALSRGDTDLSMKVIDKDQGVDKLYKRMYREMLTYMLEDPREISSSIVVSNVAKNLERISDHATNISEMVVYMARGHDIRHVNHDTAEKLLSGN